MAQAFPDIPEPAAGSEPLLQAMTACNQRMQRHCATARRLALYVGECGFDAEAGAAIGRLLHFFDHVLPHQHVQLERLLFPELIDSMAGSDAVCLREMTDGLAQQHRELSRLWLRLRPSFDQVASGAATALPVHEIEAFIAHCQAVADREDGELLPMAARLLSDAQWARIDSAMPGPT